MGGVGRGVPRPARGGEPRSPDGLMAFGAGAWHVSRVSTWRRGGGGRDALEGKTPQRWPEERLNQRLEEVAKAVGGRLLSGTNAIEAGTWRQGDSGWA